MSKIYYLPIFLFSIFLSCKVDYVDPEKAKINEQSKNYVQVEQVETKTKALPIYAIGRLGTDQEVKLSFKIGGIISSLKVDEGDYVKAGTLLGTIRTNEIDAQVLKAERVLQKSERDLERIEKMYADSAATLENVQDLRTLVQVSKADAAVATFNQKYAKIVSPVSGRIIRRMAEPNELIAPGQPVFMIASASGKTHVMKVSLSDRDINRVDIKTTANVFFDAFPGDVFEAQISTIAENADPLTGTFEIQLALNANKKRLRNGFIGRVEIFPNSDEPYLEIPIAAVVEGDESSLSVFIPVASDTLAKMISVQPFHITNTSVFVKNPKQEKLDRVITAGAPYLVDGDRIYVQE